MIPAFLWLACSEGPMPPMTCGEISPGSPDEPPNCHDLGTPCSECGGYIDADPGCSGSFHEAVARSDDSWCAMDQPLVEWCNTHLPCWDESECPTFHEFLFVSGWLGGLPTVTPDYLWGYISGGYGSVTVTRRCTTEDGAVYDAFEWRVDPYDRSFQRAYFDSASGALMSVGLHAIDACCGDQIASDRWWGPRIECTPAAESQLDFWWTRCDD